MVSAYQLGHAGGSLLALLLPIALAVFVTVTLAALRPSVGRTASSDAVGWERFHLELERSRRHERPLALLRIDGASATGDHAAPAVDPDAFREVVRVLDGIHVYVLMPEIDRLALGPAIGRILTRLPAIGLESMRVALYPDDGLTSGALVARLESRDAAPRAAEAVHLEPALAEVEQQGRTG